MGINSKSIIIVFTFLMLSCKGQKGFTSYKDCMDKNFEYTENDFYVNLGLIEDKLLEIGALKGSDKEGYVDAFKSLLGNDEIWKSYYESYLALKKTSLKEFDLKAYKFALIRICSEINLETDTIKCNPTYVQRYLFHQLFNKSFDNSDVLNGLFLFTDFKDDYLRYNMAYLLLLNMEKKYGVDDGTLNE